jgi:hypothetical protein
MEVRDLISSPRLHKILDAVELKLGAKIGLETMNPERRRLITHTSCAIFEDRRENGFTLAYIPEKTPSDVMLCHEIAHVVLCVEGFPNLRIPEMLIKYPSLFEMAHYIFNTLLHLEIWALGEQLGFSEAEQYDLDIRQKLIPNIESGYFNRLSINERCLRVFYLLLASFLSPAPDCTKNLLQAVSDKNFPDIAAQVHVSCELCRSTLPLKPEAFPELFHEVLSRLRFDSKILSLKNNILHPEPNFRTRILEVARQGGKLDL